MLKLCFYVPDSHLETVKQAIFAVGGGRIGLYDSCCWQVRGLGQFRPLAGSQPHLGEQGSLEQLEEWRVELVLADEPIARQAVAALKAAHPYETPAYDVVQVLDV
ncbi:NGG1p interacting factor NIF3 [uncultured Pseudomonas sp.]|uniref:NGG1p interacting factor NIF3 n=1 Tax=uncultured Pseudomonas sp. TaxID=114707 RepID=UPI00258EEA2B|nr:NGG1p interacting factor NIF3 [uncultured Pseudomonas sp.]